MSIFQIASRVRQWRRTFLTRAGNSPTWFFNHLFFDLNHVAPCRPPPTIGCLPIPFRSFCSIRLSAHTPGRLISRALGWDRPLGGPALRGIGHDPN